MECESIHSNNQYSLPMGAFDNDFRPSSDARHGPEETVGVYQLEPVHRLAHPLDRGIHLGQPGLFGDDSLLVDAPQENRNTHGEQGHT